MTTYKAVHDTDDHVIYIHAVDDETGTAIYAASYNYSKDYGYDPDEEPSSAELVLNQHGWLVVGDVQQSYGYPTLQVRPGNPAEIVAEVTRQLQAVRDRLDLVERGWKRLIRESVTSGEVSVSRLAQAAEVTSSRVYQIRDDRR